MARYNLGKKIYDDGTLDDLGNTIDSSDLLSIDYFNDDLVKSHGLIKFKNQEIKTEQGIIRVENNEIFINGTIENIRITSENKIELSSEDDLYYSMYWKANQQKGVMVLTFYEDVDGKTSYSGLIVEDTDEPFKNIIGPNSSNRSTTKSIYFAINLSAGEYNNLKFKFLVYGNEESFKQSLEETSYEGDIVHEKDIVSFVESEDYDGIVVSLKPSGNHYTKEEIDNMIGNVNTLLTELNTGGGV